MRCVLIPDYFIFGCKCYELSHRYGMNLRIRSYETDGRVCQIAFSEEAIDELAGSLSRPENHGVIGKKSMANPHPLTKGFLVPCKNCCKLSVKLIEEKASKKQASKSREEIVKGEKKMMMDKQQLTAVRQCDMEVMKMAMLKHEETFRQQVHELHRLYRIQRQLMSDLGRGEMMNTTTRRRSKQPRRSLNLQLPADEYIVSTDEEDNEAELELTLALGGGRSTAARRRSNRQEHNNSGGGSSPFASDCSGASLLSSSPPSSVEYYSDDGPAAVHHALPPPPPPPCQRAMAFDLGEGMIRQQAPWLTQCNQYLSLRMT
ncbi:hypothetical protein PR202_gb24047 [Eleusine coracana subsp. coracana]|uniref:Uncharacterized protein n=1 Tax=Eleusine coracana subsp. coracana TaxID=191504 RepID=A0AAV5FHS9_ELECO|nr:hypothetical protein PR202_gb24047 [Eleusine coracana subsp. coracana]